MSDPLLAALERQWGGVKIVLPSADNDNQEENPEYIISLSQKKTQEEIRKLQIANEKELRNLFEKKLMKAIIAEIGQAIKQAFVYAGRREAPTMAAKLGIPQKERDLQIMIDDMNEKGIDTVISTIEKLMDDEVFE